MNIIKSVFFTVASILAVTMVSCNREDAVQDMPETISISVDGLLGGFGQGEDTKAGLVNNIRVSWVAGDKVYAYDGANYLGELTVSLKDEGIDYYAVLSGDSIAAPGEGTCKITLVYSNAFTDAPEITDGKISLDMSDQTSGPSPESVPFVAYGTLDYIPGTAEINNQIADFALATSVMRLNCTGLEPSSSITGATLKGMSNQCVLQSYSDKAPSVGQGETGDISIAFSDGFKASANGAQVIYAAVAKNEKASNQALFLMQTQSRCFWDFGEKARDAAKSINAICQMETIVEVDEVCLSKSVLLLKVREGYALTATVLPADATFKDVTWTSDNPDVAAVENGKVTGIAEGTATIIVTSIDVPSKTAICNVTVVEVDPLALPGLFSVSAEKRVNFSRGNLRAKFNGTEWEWGFYEHQYDYNSLNTGSRRTAQSTDEEIDLFSWGYGTWSTDPVTEEYLTTYSTEGTSFAQPEDWGSQIGNGQSWRTLTLEEWNYLIQNHIHVCGLCNSIYGSFIAPDDFTGDEAALTSLVSDWAKAERDGIVFLPAAGMRRGSTIGGSDFDIDNRFDVGASGHYWSSTVRGGWYAYPGVTFFDSGIETGYYEYSKNGLSVRLVTEYL